RAVADSIAPLRREPLLARADTPAAYAYGERAADSAARITHGKASQDERDRWQKGDAISVDSARRVLGVDPLVVPGVPIEAFYRGRSIGYSGVVIVEQALDSNTMIEVINARSAPALLNEVVVTGAQPVRSRPAEAAPPPAPVSHVTLCPFDGVAQVNVTCPAGTVSSAGLKKSFPTVIVVLCPPPPPPPPPPVLYGDVDPPHDTSSTAPAIPDTSDSHFD